MSSLPLLRASLAPEYAELSEGELDGLVQEIYGPEVSAEDVESLFRNIGRGLKRASRSVGKFARRAAPALKRALPAVASGAATGAALGPWGAVVGAGAGLAGGLLSQSRNRTARGIGGAIGTAGNLVSTVRGGGASGALGSLASVASGAMGSTRQGRATRRRMRGRGRGRRTRRGSGSANALAGMLSRPELAQSLLSSLMGGAGRRSVRVGNQNVPVHQMLSALSTVSRRAAQEAAEFDENAHETPEYAENAAETLGIDAEDAEGRTDALLALLALSPSIWMQRQRPVVVQVSPPDGYHTGYDSLWYEGEDDDEGLAEDDIDFESSWEQGEWKESPVMEYAETGEWDENGWEGSESNAGEDDEHDGSEDDEDEWDFESETEYADATYDESDEAGLGWEAGGGESAEEGLADV